MRKLVMVFVLAVVLQGCLYAPLTNAKLLITKKEFNEADLEIRQYLARPDLKNEPTDKVAEAYFLLAYLKVKTENYKNATDYYDSSLAYSFSFMTKIVEERRKYSRKLYNQGVDHYIKGDNETASKYFNFALLFNDNFDLALNADSLLTSPETTFKIEKLPEYKLFLFDEANDIEGVYTLKWGDPFNKAKRKIAGRKSDESEWNKGSVHLNVPELELLGRKMKARLRFNFIGLNEVWLHYSMSDDEDGLKDFNELTKKLIEYYGAEARIPTHPEPENPAQIIEMIKSGKLGYEYEWHKASGMLKVKLTGGTSGKFNCSLKFSSNFLIHLITAPSELDK